MSTDTSILKDERVRDIIERLMPFMEKWKILFSKKDRLAMIIAMHDISIMSPFFLALSKEKRLSLRKNEFEQCAAICARWCPPQKDYNLSDIIPEIHSLIMEKSKKSGGLEGFYGNIKRNALAIKSLLSLYKRLIDSIGDTQSGTDVNKSISRCKSLFEPCEAKFLLAVSSNNYDLMKFSKWIRNVGVEDMAKALLSLQRALFEQMVPCGDLAGPAKVLAEVAAKKAHESVAAHLNGKEDGSFKMIRLPSQMELHNTQGIPRLRHKKHNKLYIRKEAAFAIEAILGKSEAEHAMSMLGKIGEAPDKMQNEPAVGLGFSLYAIRLKKAIVFYEYYQSDYRVPPPRHYITYCTFVVPSGILSGREISFDIDPDMVRILDKYDNNFSIDDPA